MLPGLLQTSYRMLSSSEALSPTSFRSHCYQRRLCSARSAPISPPDPSRGKPRRLGVPLNALRPLSVLLALQAVWVEYANGDTEVYDFGDCIALALQPGDIEATQA